MVGWILLFAVDKGKSYKTLIKRYNVIKQENPLKLRQRTGSEISWEIVIISKQKRGYKTTMMITVRTSIVSQLDIFHRTMFYVLYFKRFNIISDTMKSRRTCKIIKYQRQLIITRFRT